MKFSIVDIFSKCDQTRSFLRSFLWISSQLLKKYLMENFIFCVDLKRYCPNPEKDFQWLWVRKKNRKE